MPYIGGHVDQKLQELKQRQAARRSEVTAANKREEKKLATLLNTLDSKHDKNMVQLNTKLHVTKIDIVRDNQTMASSSLGGTQIRRNLSEEVNSFGTKKLRFGPMRMPLTTARTKVNALDSSSGSTVNKIYPFHLLRSAKVAGNTVILEKRKPLSARPFPILAAKYYRQKQLEDLKKTEKKKSKPDALMSLKKNAHEAHAHEALLRPQKSRSSHSTTRDFSPTSIPNGSLPSLTRQQQQPPPNSPRVRRSTKESYMHSETMPGTDGVSNEEIHALRSGKYFLRYSTSSEMEKQDEIGGQDEMEKQDEWSVNDSLSKDITPAKPRSENISRHKSRVDDVINEIENANKPLTETLPRTDETESSNPVVSLGVGQ